MKQKTVRFYDDAPEDMKAAQILDDCRKYGYTSAREMIIAAVNSYVQGGSNSSLDTSSWDMDKLADKIAMRLQNGKVAIKETGHNGDISEYHPDNNECYQKALNFIDTL